MVQIKLQIPEKFEGFFSGPARNRVAYGGRGSSKSWTIAQMLAHHTSNGCNVRSGDLMAGGTVPGGTGGSLYDITVSRPIELPTGEERRVLHDGDEIIIAGYCEREGSARIGFGECRGVIAAAF